MILQELVTFKGEILCKTGLSIGGNSSTLEIGGIDREVIKNPITREPYIPGSSLKGKMRSGLESKYGAYNKKQDKYLINDEAPCGCGRKTCPVCLIFGAHKNQGAESAPTRIIVRDAALSDASRNMIRNFPLEQGSYLERKTENIILRKSGKAGSPRTMERVPAGVSFTFEISLKIFEGDNKEELVGKVKESLELVEKSYLGGGGSRGSGQVEFKYDVTYDQIQKETEGKKSV